MEDERDYFNLSRVNRIIKTDRSDDKINKAPAITNQKRSDRK